MGSDSKRPATLELGPLSDVACEIGFQNDLLPEALPCSGGRGYFNA